MKENILVAIIASVPTTLASIAALIRVIRLGKTTEQVNRAVNHQPKDAPTLVERVIEMSSDLKEVHVKTEVLGSEVRELKAAQRRHLAWHQEVEEL
jgi:hypothetical protein